MQFLVFSKNIFIIDQPNGHSENVSSEYYGGILKFL